MEKNKKTVGTLGVILGSTLAMIGSASAAIDPAGFVTEVTNAVTGAETVLVAGLAIVGSFFVWKILKKALSRAA